MSASNEKTVGSVAATKTFDPPDDDPDDMPLPTDPKTVFLGGKPLLF